ncbi:MAG: magnesium transporter [Bacteroidetes bacterium]|nr:magnesium transporter [Bacteroidota bacterium]
MREKSQIDIDKEFISDIKDLVDSKAEYLLRNILSDLHPADISEILDHLDEQERNFVFEIIDTEKASDVILELDTASREDILEHLDEVQISEIIDEMQSDDAANIVQELDDETATRVLEKLDFEESQEVRELLKYEEDTAGGIMQLEFVDVYETESVRQAIDEVREKSKDVQKIYDIFVVNREGILVGVVSTEQLLMVGPDEVISDIMNTDVISARTNEDQEEVANRFKKYDLVTLPVVTPAGKLVGRVTIDDIVDVIEQEASEDVSKMAGSVDEDVTETSTLRISRSRLPWLMTALVGELVAAFVLSRFETSLNAVLALAFFLPIIMAMAGNVAIQCSSIVIRGLATGEIRLLDVQRQVFKELRVAMVNGVVLGVILSGIVSFWIGNLEVALVVSVALVCVIFFAALNGTLFPLILKRLRVDPALAAGPFVTMTNDTLGILIYLGIATLFLVRP